MKTIVLMRGNEKWLDCDLLKRLKQKYLLWDEGVQGGGQQMTPQWLEPLVNGGPFAAVVLAVAIVLLEHICWKFLIDVFLTVMTWSGGGVRLSVVLA